jgi:hypothetical protein
MDDFNKMPKMASWNEQDKQLTPKRFRKKPVVIEAKKLTVDSFDDVFKWIEINHGSIEQWEFDEEHTWMMIKTLEGDHKAQLNDWIIKGVAGEFYPCKPDIFEMTYEPVDIEFKHTSYP